jgi:hypothetical protein
LFIPGVLSKPLGGHADFCRSTLDPVAEQLSKLPDCRLVDITSPGEMVRIEADHGRLIIRAVSPGERVHVSIPIPMAARILRRVAQASDACGSRPARGALIAI